MEWNQFLSHNRNYITHTKKAEIEKLLEYVPFAARRFFYNNVLQNSVPDKTKAVSTPTLINDTLQLELLMAPLQPSFLGNNDGERRNNLHHNQHQLPVHPAMLSLSPLKRGRPKKEMWTSFMFLYYPLCHLHASSITKRTWFVRLVLFHQFF